MIHEGRKHEGPQQNLWPEFGMLLRLGVVTSSNISVELLKNKIWWTESSQKHIESSVKIGVYTYAQPTCRVMTST